MRFIEFDTSEVSPATVKLILALAFSLALHLALAFLVRVMPENQAETHGKALQINLAGTIAADSPPANKKPPDSTERKAVFPAVPDNSRTASIPSEKSPDKPSAPPPAPFQSASPAPQPLPIADTPSPPSQTASRAVAVQAAPSQQSALPTVDIPLIEDTTYYTAKQVDRHPTPVKPIKPEFPETVKTAGVEGFVTPRLSIDATGVVREISVVEAHPPETFETAALNAFRNARFVAARRNDRPVKSDVLIKVTFELASRNNG